MPRRVLALCLAAFCAQARAEEAQVTSPAPEKVAVTIYRDGDVTSRALIEGGGGDGLVLVRETRTINLPAGTTRVSFEGVADWIVPQSAAIEGLPLGLVERNFDYDLMTPGSLLEKSVGEHVTLVRTNPRTGVEDRSDAILRSAPSGMMLQIGQTLEALHCSGGPERLEFAQAPAALRPSPTLSALINTREAGRYKVRLSYLALGMNWAADYVARVNDDGKTLDLSGWITLANNTDTTFNNAPTEVVAGSLSRVGSDPPRPAAIYAYSRCWPISSGRMQATEPLPPPPPPPPPPMAAPMARAIAEDSVVVTGSFIAKQRELGDYKLYEVTEPTRVAARQIKQVQFLDQHAVPFTRLYQYSFGAYDIGDAEAPPRSTSIVLRLLNKESGGLGKPLPQGNVAVFENAAGGKMLTGEDKIDDMPVGLPIDWEIGKTSTVRVRPRLVSETDRGKTARKVIEFDLANSQSTPVDFELVYRRNNDERIAREDKRHIIREGKITWPIKLAAGARRTFAVTIDIDD